MFYAPDPAMLYLLQPTTDDLIGLDRNIAELRERDAAGSAAPLPHQVFQYAAALISHSRKDYLEEGVKLMEGLVFQVWRRREKEEDAEKEQAGDDGKPKPKSPQSTQDMLPVYYYYIAIAWTKLEDHVKARRGIERMLMLEPQSSQGIHLRDHISKQQTKEGLVGLAGATVALGAAIACLSILRRK